MPIYPKQFKPAPHTQSKTIEKIFDATARDHRR